MTIRFTKSWNGYYEGQIVTSPSGRTEAELIALGYAVSDLDGPDNSGPLARFNTDPLTGRATGLTDPSGGAVPLMGNSSFTADDVGTTWAACPKLIDMSATLASGTSTTVLLEVRTSAGVVSTAATITADTVSQVLRQTFTTRGYQDFRIRRSSGTGSVTITL